MGEIVEAGTLSRYDMSNRTFRQLQRDHIRFEEEYADKFRNGFICRILINFMCYCQELSVSDFENDVLRAIEHQGHGNYLKGDRISFTKELAEKMQEFKFVDHDDFRKRTVISFMLDNYTDLSLSERELVYCYSQYKIINEAIDKNEIMMIRISNGKEFEVIPYKLEVDDNSFSYYLICLSRLKGSDEGYECHSIKLSRIKKCLSRHTEHILSAKEINNLDDIRDKFGSAYIISNLTKKEIEKTVVRLTERGYKLLYLKSKSHLRPIPISAPKQVNVNDMLFFDLTFDCSYQQIQNYFFSFGREAEIVLPLSLRERFISDYENALNMYRSNDL